MQLYKYKHYFRITLVSILMLICWLAFSQPAEQLFSSGDDKVNHLLAFMSLAFLFDYSFPLKTKQLVIILLGFGLLIELIQSTIPHRQADIGDLLADSVGIFLFVIMKPLRAKTHG